MGSVHVVSSSVPLSPDNGPMGHCPSCGSTWFAAVSNGFDVNYRCATCWACWCVSFGRASRVDPFSCPACADAGHCRGAPLDEIGARGDVAVAGRLAAQPDEDDPFKGAGAVPMNRA